MALTITLSLNGQLTNDDLDALQARLEIDLPADYRAFLLAHNGGHPEPYSFPLGDENWSDVDLFFGIAPGEYDDLENMSRVMDGRLPAGLLAIGTAPNGDKICLGLTGLDCGKVFYWEHELEADEGEPAYWDNITLVADSFTSFLDRLTEYPDEDEDEEDE